MNDLIIDVIVRNRSFFVFSCEGLHFLYVCLPVCPVKLQRFLLGGTFDVWLILKQLLDSCQNCLYCDVRFPVFFVVENRKANSSGGVDVGVRNHWFEDTFGRSSL